jgi:hypothetical protein
LTYRLQVRAQRVRNPHALTGAVKEDVSSRAR